MGCTNCKEDPTYSGDVPYNTQLKTIKTLDGLKRINSPNQSFIDGKTSPKGQNHSVNQANGPKNENESKMVMVTNESIETPREDQKDRAEPKHTKNVSQTSLNKNGEDGLDAVRFESESSAKDLTQTSSYEKFIKQSKGLS